MKISPLTYELTKQDGMLRAHNEGDWHGPFNSNATGFTSFNDAGLECEVGELLYSLVRVLKPEHVLETGTHWGVGASYIGNALRDNGVGHLDTIEFLPENHSKAKSRIESMGLSQFVTCHFGDVANFQVPEDWRGSNETVQLAGGTQPKIKYGLILLDTEPQTRFAELLKFYDNLEEGGYLFIHDLHRHMHQIPNEDHGFAWPYGPLPEAIKQLVQDDKLRPFHFTTPRGLTGFYKVSSLDYKFYDVAKRNENAWKYEEACK